MLQQNVEFVEGLVAGAVKVDKQALLAALPELVAASEALHGQVINDIGRRE
jgi:hypothetical protein